MLAPSDIISIYLYQSDKLYSAAELIRYSSEGVTNMPLGSARDDSLEEAISRAVDAKNRDPDLKFSSLAQKFGVPYCRLRWRYIGKNPRAPPQAVRKLTDVQETELVHRLSDPNDEANFEDTQSIECVANQILARDHIGELSPPIVTSLWCWRFVRRHSQKFKGKIDPRPYILS